MKFLIDLATFVVTSLPQGTSWSQLRGVTNNGQHYQLAGSVLAEYRPSENELILLHPTTEATAGHQDVKYYSSRRDGEYGVSIVMYTHWTEIDFANENEVKYHWPNGGEHLLKTIVSAEEYLELAIGYEPRLMSYISHNFRQTPVKSNIPVGMMA